MPTEDESVLDAVNAALEDTVTPEPESAPDTDADPAPDSESAVGDGDSEDAEGAGEPEGEPEGEKEPEGEEKGPNGERERNPDGTWKPTAKVEDKKEPPKKDPINDPIPGGLKKETSERIRTLIDTAKSVTAERDKISQDFNYLIKGVEATGTSPEQYGETLSWLALFNSRDPAQQEKALELVESVAERLATLLGKERNIGDPLSAHPDLQDAVKKGQVTTQYAKEIARTRNGQQFRTELTTGVQRAEQQKQSAANELQTARTSLSELETTLQGTDPDYEAKKAILVPALRPAFATIPPSQWRQKFEEAYRAINLPRAAPQRATVKTPVNQPLRAGKQPAGGQTKAPSSMLEAMDAALTGMKK
jgi:hypothetical protein